MLQDPNRPLPLPQTPAANSNIGGGGTATTAPALPDPRSGPIGPSSLPNPADPNYLPSPVAAAKMPAKGPQIPEGGIPPNAFGHLGISVLPLDNGEGLKVVGIEPKSPAFPAGLLIGDEITSINGQRITKFADLVAGLRTAAQGDGNVTLLVRRRGTLDTINVMVGGKKAITDRPRIGVTLDDSNGQLRITGVVPNSPAALAGARPGDEIVTVNDYPVSTYDLFVGQIQALGRAGGQVSIGVRRNGQLLILRANLTNDKAPPLPKSELPPTDPNNTPLSPIAPSP